MGSSRANKGNSCALKPLKIENRHQVPPGILKMPELACNAPVWQQAALLVGQHKAAGRVA